MEFAICGAKLREALCAVKRTVSSDETRPHLASAMVELRRDGLALTAVSTDGHRLARYTARLAMPPGDAVWNGDATIYATTAQIATILRAIGPAKRAATVPVTLATGENGAATLTIGTVAIGLQGPDGWKFPPYEQVIPTHAPGPFVGVGLSPRYLADACDAAREIGAEGVTFTAAGPLDPIRIDATMPDSGGTLTVVVMPMRLDRDQDAWDRAVRQWVDGEAKSAETVTKKAA